MILDQFGKSTEIFDGRAKVLHTGTNFGIVHPSSQDFAGQFQRIRSLTGQDAILAQKLGFNTKVTPIAKPEDMVAQEVEGFHRTPEVTDGVVVSINNDTLIQIAVMIMNADCGTIEILAPNGEMAVLHGGFENVDNKDGTSIVINAIKYFEGKGIDPKDLKFRMGEAAQVCCYGVNDPRYAEANTAKAERIATQYGADTVGLVKNLPRSANNGIAFNVPLIAARQAEQAGVQEVSIEELCTSCHGLADEVIGQMDTHGDWYSNLRESAQSTKDRGGYGSRNAAVVYAA